MKKLTFLLTFLLFVSFQAAAQMQITGVVTSEDTGEPIPGVSVVVKGQSDVGTSTDIEGKYQLEVSSDAETLVFSFVGMETKEVDIEGREEIDVTLTESVSELEEVLVVAYGTATKESFTGSAGQIGEGDLSNRKITSPIGAIEGNTSGVQVMSASGQPGSSPSVVIRGVGTLTGSSSPLYVVDGVQYEGSLANLNTEDIESMTVLKDAASTSLYGSRAANGVVMITTKSGKESKGIKVNASVERGAVSPAIPFYDKASPGEYYELMGEAYKNALVSDGMTDEEASAQASEKIYNRLAYNPFDVENDNILGEDGKLNPDADLISKSLDWYDALSQQGSRENYSLNLSGGGEDYDLYFSTSYLDETGYIVTSAYDRFTTRLKGNFKSTDWLKIGGNMNISMTNREGPFSRGSSIANPFGFAKNMGSIYPVYLVDPETGDYILDEAGDKQYDLGGGYSEYGISSRPNNPDRHAIAEAQWNSDVRMTNNISSRYYAEFTILPELKLTVNYGLDVNDYINKEYENHKVGDGAPSGRYSELRYRRTVQNFNQLLTYNKNFDSGHNFDITLGHENFDRHYSNNSGMKNNQTAVGIHEFDNFSSTSELAGYSSDKRTEGYFGRLNYNYRYKYYLTASARRDGSSVFNKDVRWGNFYSAGGSWRITREPFMQALTFVDDLRLKASYGQVGQDNLGDYYLSQPRYSLYTNAGEPGIYWSDLGNTALTWETSSNWDIALEYTLFDNLFDGSIEYWEKISTDLLYDLPLPLSEGLSTGPENIASMVNSGLEFSLTTNIIREKELGWSLTLNASTVNNEITDLPEPFVDGSKRWEEGRTRYDYFIYDYAGVDPDNGDALYYKYEEVVDDETGLSTFEPVTDGDGNHETTNDYQDAGKAYADKNTLPDLFGGVENNFTYKGFDLSILLTYGIGGHVLDYGYARMMNEGEYGESLHPDLLDGWREPGDDTDVPRMENGNTDLNQSMSTRYLTDASYLSLRNVSLSYTFNQDFIRNIGIENLSLFLVAENLFTFTNRKGLDPQYNLAGTPAGDDYNPARVISGGLNITF
ncbi:MAG: SusC/RagA family TonB-linked outer membrane protein [Bacteroidales bacterium]